MMYLKNLPHNTFTTYSRVLKHAKSIEDQLGKDLYDFNVCEIEQLLSFLNPKTFASSLSSASIVQNYIRWAIGQNLRFNSSNPLDIIIGDEFISKFIDASQQTIFSAEEIDMIIQGLVNYQDSAVVAAIFEGILGKGYSELLNLTRYDLHNMNDFILKNDICDMEQIKRAVKVSDRLLELLRRANQEQIYYKNNGNPAASLKAPISKLVDNEYIFRSAWLHTKELGRADSHLVLRRLKKIAVWNKQPCLTAINIRNSGMLYMAYCLYKEHKKFGKAEFDAVCEHFNIPKLKNSKDFNASRLRKEFLNLHKMKEVYEKGTD